MGSVSCPKCNKAFACTGDLNCWCFGYTLTQEQREKMARFSDDCFCPECLEKEKVS